jgi:hypothetical protein
MIQVQYKGLTKGFKRNEEILLGVVMLTVYTPVHGSTNTFGGGALF